MANKEQRKVNRFIRTYNKALADDIFLGLNRFAIKQISKPYTKPVWDTRYMIHLCDHKTNEFKELFVDNYDYRRVLLWGMNDFIVAIRLKENW